MNFNSAGSRRKRKNAVDIHGNYEKYDTDKGPRGKGRPSKGGQALRAKRYYIKNHLLVLQKRKLKRYMDKVKKLAAESNYNPNAIMDKLGPKCQEYTKRHHPNIKYNCLLYVLNMAREDQHLEFLNEEGLEYLGEVYEEGESPYKEDALELQQSLASCHSLLQFQLSSLLSAYLLTRHIQKVHKDVEDKEEQGELIKRDCVQYYEISYAHLQAVNDEQECVPPVAKKQKVNTTPQPISVANSSLTTAVKAEEASDGSSDNSSDDSSIADETSAVPVDGLKTNVFV